jgi:hypothetical protein
VLNECRVRWGGTVCAPTVGMNILQAVQMLQNKQGVRHLAVIPTKRAWLQQSEKVVGGLQMRSS